MPTPIDPSTYPKHSVEARDRVNSLVAAIATLRSEAYGAHCSQLPALNNAAYYLSIKLVRAMGQENPHVKRRCGYEEQEPS